MEEIKNLDQDDVLDLITDFPIEPMRNRLIITTNVEEMDPDEVDLQGAAFSPEQYVLAVGSYTKDFLKPGQKIYLDLEAMSVRVPSGENAYDAVTSIQIHPVRVGEKVFGMITDDKIAYKIVN